MLDDRSKVDGVVTPRITLLPGDVALEVSRSEHLVADLVQVGALVVVDADEDGAIGAEQVARQHKPGVDHRAPVGVEAAVGLGVGHKAATLFVEVTALGVVLLVRLGKVVVVDEVMSRVVGWIDIDELHLASVGLLEELERIQVVALDVEVPRRVPVHGLLGLRPHGLPDGLSGFCLRGGLAGPGELVALTLAFGAISEKVVQGVIVHTKPERTVRVLNLGECFREEYGNLLDVLLDTVRSTGL